jgi:hypothetical protein
MGRKKWATEGKLQIVYETFGDASGNRDVEYLSRGALGEDPERKAVIGQLFKNRTVPVFYCCPLES